MNNEMKQQVVQATDNRSDEEKAFDFSYRKAQAFITGSILPQHFKNIGDVMILDDMSRSLNIPMIMLAQQVYMVKGKAGMSGQLAIALLNKSNKFSKPILFEEKEQDFGIRAYSYIDNTRVNGEWITDELIQANGWLTNTKWGTMKNQMARYRSATWFGRVYAPEVLMGFRSEDELIEEAEVIVNKPTIAQNDDDIDLNAMMENEVIQEPKKAEPETNTQTLKPKTDATLLSEIMVNDYEIPENIVKQWIEANDNYVTEVLNDVDKIGMLAENLTNS